jgi:rod shape-determining protein MreD
MAISDQTRPRDIPAASWHAVIALTALVLLSAVPLPVGHGPLPDIVLIGIYLACSRRVGSISLGIVFCLGLLQDLLGSTPFGMNALVYVLVHAAASQTRLLTRTFLGHWLGFAPCAIIAAAASWAVISVHYTSLVSADPIIAQTLATILAFPLIAAPIHWFAGALHDQA